MGVFCIIFFLILGVIIIKASLNVYSLWRLRTLEKEYETYQLGLINQTASWDFNEKTPELKELLIKAGQSSSGIPDIENLGVGVVQVTVDVFDNMTANNERIAILMKGTIKQAIGVYKKRICDAFNPFYWLEFLIYLPQKILGYISGYNEQLAPRWVARLLNAIYWIAGFTSAIWAILDHLK